MEKTVLSRYKLKSKPAPAVVSTATQAADEPFDPQQNAMPLGWVQVEGEGRKNKWKTNIRLRCCAYAVTSSNSVLLVSAAGDESATKEPRVNY